MVDNLRMPVGIIQYRRSNGRCRREGEQSGSKVLEKVSVKGIQNTCVGMTGLGMAREIPSPLHPEGRRR